MTPRLSWFEVDEIDDVPSLSEGRRSRLADALRFLKEGVVLLKLGWAL
jgi:hypothetical protein